LLLRHLGKTERAEQLMRDCGDKPNYAAFYAVRADWLPENAFEDISRAVALEPYSWRYGVRLARLYHEQGEYDKMLATTQKYLKLFPSNDPLVLLHTQSLIANKQYSSAVSHLQKAVILPNEGGLSGRNIYREATLLLAAKYLRMNNRAAAKQWVQAARRWPENLGSGKPYPSHVDERIEDWLDSLCNSLPESPSESPWETLPELEDVLVVTGKAQSVLVKKILEELHRHDAQQPEPEDAEVEPEDTEVEPEMPEPPEQESVESGQ